MSRDLTSEEIYELGRAHGAAILRAERAEAQLTEARRILKLMEWTEGSYGQYCLVCDGYHPNHAPDCALAHAIR